MTFVTKVLLEAPENSIYFYDKDPNKLIISSGTE